MQVLVTGASGAIGTAFVRSTPPGGELELVRADLHDASGDDDGAWPFVALDVTDAHACAEACQGMDAVVHLAADADPAADLRTRVLPLNVLGTINVFDAVVAAGVSRVVFASSGQVVIGDDRPGVPEHAAPRPTSHYGAGKAFGEALCASYAATSTTTFVALRLGAFAASPDGVDPGHRSAWLSHRDAAHLIERALLAPLDDRYLVVNGTSANAGGRLDLQLARRMLGYEPVDDAGAWGVGCEADRTHPRTDE